MAQSQLKQSTMEEWILANPFAERKIRKRQTDIKKNHGNMKRIKQPESTLKLKLHSARLENDLMTETLITVARERDLMSRGFEAIYAQLGSLVDANKKFVSSTRNNDAFHFHSDDDTVRLFKELRDKTIASSMLLENKK
jgi:hypothetical protein